MIKYENECVDCTNLGLPCIDCGRKNVKHLYCDKCGDDVEELYLYDSDGLCEECLLEAFEKITL